MHIKINHILGIKRAAFDLDGIVEIIGPNASGKTSIATVAQALLSHDANPLHLPAPMGKTAYTHGGEAEGYAELIPQHTEGFPYESAVTWAPARGGITVAANSTAYSRPEALGLEDFTTRRGDKERMIWLQAALLPPEDVILANIRETLEEQLPLNDLSAVMEIVQKRGIEAAENIYIDRGKEAKREWTAVTGGQRYGVKVAADWRPAGWLADMDSMTVGGAEEAVTVAREQLSLLHQVQAVSEAQAAEAEEAAAALPAKQTALAQAQANLDKANADLAAIPRQGADKAVAETEREIARVRRYLVTDPSFECPHCKERVVWNDADGILHPFCAEEAEKLKSEMRAELGKLEGQLADRVATHRKAESDYDALAKKVRAAEDAVNAAATEVAVLEKSATNAGSPIESEENRAALAQAEQNVDDARNTLTLVKAEARAAELAETILRYAEVVRALGPQGVRARMLEGGLKSLNAGLARIANAARWPFVKVSGRALVTWDDRPVALCSESERWRAQAAIQLTLGAITKSKAVVLDRADLLDPCNREGLAKAVQHVAGATGMAVLLCSTGSPDAGAPWRQIVVEGGVAGE